MGGGKDPTFEVLIPDETWVVDPVVDRESLPGHLRFTRTEVGAVRAQEVSQPDPTLDPKPFLRVY